MVTTVRGDRTCQNKQLSTYNMRSENKEQAARGPLLGKNGDYNTGKRIFIIQNFTKNAHMIDHQLQYRLPIGDGVNHTDVGRFLASSCKRIVIHSRKKAISRLALCFLTPRCMVKVVCFGKFYHQPLTVVTISFVTCYTLYKMQKLLYSFIFYLEKSLSTLDSVSIYELNFFFKFIKKMWWREIFLLLKKKSCRKTLNFSRN